MEKVVFTNGCFDILHAGHVAYLEEAKARLTIVIPICFVLIFLLLFSTFGNGKDAVLVFTAVPLALTGGVVSLWLRGMPLEASLMLASCGGGGGSGLDHRQHLGHGQAGSPRRRAWAAP